MHNKHITATVAALVLTMGSSAFAQGGPDNGPGRDQRPRPGQQQQRDDRHDNNRGHAVGRPDGRPPMQADNRGAGPDHNFRRGGRLPNEYRNHQYVVNDWRGHHLNAPPRGYHWVQTGGDYVLVAIATGIIAQILLGQ